MDFSYKSKTRLDSIKKRSRRCLCKTCGEKLSLRRIIFNEIEVTRVEIFCEQCGGIEYGVEPEIYAKALDYVDKLGFNAFPDMPNNDADRRRSIAKVCEIITWENKNLGIINEDGFQVPIFEKSEQTNIPADPKARLYTLKKRSKRCLCKYCGGKLSMKRILYNELEPARLEIFCDQCGRLDYGVEPEIYTSAKYFVEEDGFNAFPDMEDNDVTRQRSIAKVCEIMMWANKNLGIIKEEGFQIPIKANKNILGECVVLTRKDLESFVEKEPREYDMDEIKDIEVFQKKESSNFMDAMRV